MARGGDGAAVFGRDSHVREYWLAHAAGFELRHGRGRCGRVEDVVADGPLGRATTLVVRMPRRSRPTFVPAHRVAAVDPFVRLLYVERPDRVRATARTTSSAAGRSAHVLAAAVRVVVRAVRIGSCWSLPHLRTAAVAARAWMLAARLSSRRAWSWLQPHLLLAAAEVSRGARRAGCAVAVASRRVPPFARRVRHRVALGCAAAVRVASTLAGRASRRRARAAGYADERT